MKEVFGDKLAAVLLIVFGVAACAQVPKESGFADIQKMVGQRIDYRLQWNQGTEADEQVEQAVEDLLKEEISVDAAIQIALLNNPNLHVIYEELGVTQADVVEAGLLDNPVIFGQARFPDIPPSGTNLEFGIAKNFLKLLMMPARRKLAAIQFERTKLRVSNEILMLTADVEKSYYTVLGAKQIRQMRRLVTEAAQNSFELARRLYAAGNISDLELANEQGQYEQARINQARAESALLDAREHLTGLMGLWGGRIHWTLPDRLPDIPGEEITLDHLEAFAVQNRLDLAAKRKEMEALAQALGITVDWRWIGDVEVGISTERDTDGQWVTGPSLAIELPIFNQRQADIARIEAEFRQGWKRLAAWAVDIRSEIRLLRNRLIINRNIVTHYGQVVLPLRERIVELTLKKYNYMLVGAFDLLTAKQLEYDSYQNYIEAVRDYWVVRTELQRAVGGRLTTRSSNANAVRTKAVPNVGIFPVDGAQQTNSYKNN